MSGTIRVDLFIFLEYIKRRKGVSYNLMVTKEALLYFVFRVSSVSALRTLFNFISLLHRNERDPHQIKNTFATLTNLL